MLLLLMMMIALTFLARPAGMERVVFYRERGALPYDPFAYGAAIALVEVPYLIIQVGGWYAWSCSDCNAHKQSHDIS